QHFRFKICVRNSLDFLSLDIVSHIVCSQQLAARPLFRSPLSPQLDVVTDIWFPARLAPRTVSAASYTFEYSAAGAFQEKSLAIPFNWMRFQMRSSVQWCKAWRIAFIIAVPEYSANLKPVPVPCSKSNGSTVSSSPPVARTIGTVPYFKL